MFRPKNRRTFTLFTTNRTWTDGNNEKKEQTEYHTVILWGKLAEISSQYLHKGEKAYFQGRLQTRSYTAKDGTQKSATEIIAEDMLMLSGGRMQERSGAEEKRVTEEREAAVDQADQNAFDVDPEEIPF